MVSSYGLCRYNAGSELRPEAGARHERTLEGVGSTAWFGPAEPQGTFAILPSGCPQILSVASSSSRVYNPNTTRRSLSTSACNCGPSRPRRRTITDRSTAANLCMRKTDVTRRLVRANSGWVFSTVESVGAKAPRTTLEIAMSTMSWPMWLWNTTTAGRREAPVKSVNGKRVRTTSPRARVGGVTLVHRPLRSKCLPPPPSRSQRRLPVL